ncbi:MAG TPA: hypothetical protein VNN22_02295 [Verrucomicrobiae bacterium]|nr:hypothetical protein [Verrucomicrobiae bacterium]
MAITRHTRCALRRVSVTPGRLYRSWLGAGLLFASPSLAGLLPGNLWPNPTLETDSSSDGVPDFWNKGGSNPNIESWTNSMFVSPTQAFMLNDRSTTDYGEWYSNLLPVTGGTSYLLRYNLRHVISSNGTMRVSANFYNAGNTLLSGLNFTFSGTNDFWQEKTQPLVVPSNATQLGLTFTSGGTMAVTGVAYLDDISLALQTNASLSLIPYIEGFPAMPTPLVVRDWKQTATSYHQLAFNPSATGQYLPLLYSYSVATLAGYSGPAFGLPSYVGNPRDGGEALTALGAVLGGTLAGLNMAALNGVDRVAQCEAFYSVVNGHGLVLNNINSQGSGSGWYDIFPCTLFYQIGARYPGRALFQSNLLAIAESWRSALPVLSNNWQHTGFNFQTMTTVDSGHVEPDMAIGIAWLEYMAYLQFQNTNYLAAADLCMTQMNTNGLNPFYETLGFYGPVLAARMDAELGRSYSVSRHLNWIFASTSDVRPGWGCESGSWGGQDAYGLMGSTTDTGGYTFSMNTYSAAGLITPVVRYQPQYARLLGRWLLHVAANANLFYPGTLTTDMQSSSAWVQQTGVTNISYEGVRNLGTTTPYATGDAAAPIQDLNPYGAWGSGFLAALFQTSSVPGILKVDCLATETLPPPASPTFLFYNPYSVTQPVTVNVGSNATDLYDAVTGTFAATHVTGNASISILPDNAVVLVQCFATGVVSQAGQKLLVSGVVIDYQNGTLDTDGDGLPDWWESLYCGNRTNALAPAAAANGFSNLQCYWLGLNPLDPASTFRVHASVHPLAAYPTITWNSVGGKTYAVEYASNLTGGGSSFVQALIVTETNVAAGVQTTNSFVDNDSLTGGSPACDRFYRVRLVYP